MHYFGKTFYYMILIVFLLGTFLVNYFPDLVLFDSGAIRSFVSQSFSRSFDMALIVLKCPLRASIANGHMVFASRIF